MKTLIAAALFLGLATPVLADSATGVWLRDNGKSKVRIAPCGDKLCGHVVWVKDPDSPSKVGQRVFFNMKESGDSSWTGNAFNPENGKTYSGKMSVKGNTLTTSGCVFGGLICQSVSWSRSSV